MRGSILFILFFYSTKVLAQNVTITISDTQHFFKTVQYIEPDIRRVLNMNVKVENLNYDSEGKCILYFNINSTTDLHLFDKDVLIDPNEKVLIKIASVPGASGAPHLSVITKYPGNFLWRKKLQGNNELLNGIINSKKYSLLECKNKLFLNYKALLDTLQSFCAHNPVSPQAKEIFKKELFFYYVQGLCTRYASGHDSSVTFEKYFEGIDYGLFTNGNLLKNSFIYRNCLLTFFNEVSENFIFISYLSPKTFTAQFQKIKKFKNDFTRDYLYAHLIGDYFVMKNTMHDNVEELTKTKDSTVNLIKDINIRREVLSLAGSNEGLKKINYVGLNKIEIETVNQEKKTLLSLINENKGKVIVCDVWASWCVPCLNEFNFYSSLIPKFKNNQVLFVTVSIDESRISWQKKVSGLPQTMNHYILNDGTSNNLFSSMFGITEIPRTIIFNTQGTLVNYYGARPSEGNALEHQIDKLLKPDLR